MKFVCETLFDITCTGVTGHLNFSRLPFTDKSGQIVQNAVLWNRSRNQQRNWETITQILSLRTQLFELGMPIQDQTGSRWMFEFETDIDGVYGDEFDPVAVLRSDAHGVPMLLNLGNRPDIDPVLVTQGLRQNIWFSPISINT